MGGNTLSYSQQLLLLIKPKMPLKLTYFDLRARADPTRLILAQAGVEFEDERLPAPWDDMAPWTAMKPTTPFGVLPILCGRHQDLPVHDHRAVLRTCLRTWRQKRDGKCANGRNCGRRLRLHRKTTTPFFLKRTRPRRPSCRRPTQRRPDPPSSSSWRLASARAAENTLWVAS